MRVDSDHLAALAAAEDAALSLNAPVVSAYCGVSGFGTPTYQSAPANVYELGDTYQIAFLIPGIDPHPIQLTALGNSITVAGEMQVSAPEGASAV